MNVVTDAPPSAAPPGRRLVPGVVDVWRTNLSAAADGARADGLMDLLCEEERERAARIAVAHRRILWARSRGVLRALLGRYLDADPRELRFTLGAHGKPTLAGTTEPASGLRFNLSHSGELMLVAVSTGREIGVDVELVRDRYPAEFLRAWTMREAIAKCLGTGLISTSVMPATREPSRSHADRPQTAELDVGPRATAAIAVAGEEVCELRCQDTPPRLTP